jgi:hypothetical protein
MEDRVISSAEESLGIIGLMIDRAKRNVADNSPLFLLRGWLLFGATLIQFALKVFFSYPWHYVIWAAVYAAFIALRFPMRRKHTKRMSRTWVDQAIRHLWTGMILSYALITLVFFRIGWDHCYTFYIVLMATGCFLTGKLLDFPPLVIGATICAVLAILSTFLDFDSDMLICALAILVSYIIPGYLLRARYRKGELTRGYKLKPNV